MRLLAVGAFLAVTASGCNRSGYGSGGTMNMPAPSATSSSAHASMVTNDGSFDSGDITPGGSSQTMRLSSSAGRYQCTIHPTMMFGAVN